MTMQPFSSRATVDDAWRFLAVKRGQDILFSNMIVMGAVINASNSDGCSLPVKVSALFIASKYSYRHRYA